MAYISPDQPFKIVNRKSGSALSASGAANNADVVLWKFIDGEGQLWHLIDVGGGAFRIESRQTGRVLAAHHLGGAPNPTLCLRDDEVDAPTRRWRLAPTPAGFVQITSQASPLVIACAAGGTTNGTMLLLWESLGFATDQEWSIEPVPAFDPAGTYRLVNRKANQLLCLVDAGTANGTRTNLFPDVAAEDQRWHIIDLRNGYVKLVNHHSGRVLSTLDGESSNGTAVHLWDDLMTASDQHWAISPTSDGFVKILNRLCGRAVSCVDGSTASRTLVHLWEFLGTEPDQEWRIEQVEQRVEVFAGEVIARPSPHMTGLCLEDVNHSVYGGLDSQMIFGESFQEPPPIDPGALYRLINQKGAGALSIRQRGFANGSLAITRPVASSSAPEPDQLWQIVDVGAGFHTLVNHQSGRLLSTLEGGSSNNTPVHLWADMGAPDQHWALVGRGDVVRLMNRTSRRVASALDSYIDGSHGETHGDTHDGARVVLFDYNGAFNPDLKHQDWKLEPVVAITRPEVSGMWRAFSRGGASGTFSLGASEPPRNWRPQKIVFSMGAGEVGLENRSLNRWGMNVQAGVTYEGYVYARAPQSIELNVALERSAGASPLAAASLAVNGAEWTRYDFTLVPSATDAHGRFVVSLKQPGSIELGFVFLQPEQSARFRELPVRKDVGEALEAQQNPLMRFGGSSVNAATYRWKNMQGPRDQRQFTGGLFYDHTSNGWMIPEFLQLTEALGIVGVPTLSIDEPPEEVVAFLRSVNGSPASPPRVRYLELGNELGNVEPRFTPQFFDKFAKLAAYVWERDADVQLILGDWEHQDVIRDDPHFNYGRVLNLDGYVQALNAAADHGRELWIDCHLWTDDVNPGRADETRYDTKVLTQVAALQSLGDKLQGLVGRARFKLVVFELNANSHDLQRALAKALAMNALLRLGDMVRMVATANALQPFEQNDNVWDQGLLFFDSHRVWAQPAYYVNQMKAANAQPLVVRAHVQGRESHTLDVTATLSADGRTLILHVVNTLHVQRRVRVALHRFEPALSTARFTVLSGAPSASNSADRPRTVAPVEFEVDYPRFGDEITLTFAPSSFTLVRLQ